MTKPDYIFCIAHRPPLYKLPDNAAIVATGAYQDLKNLGGGGENPYKLDAYYELNKHLKKYNIIDSPPLEIAGHNDKSLVDKYNILTGTCGSLHIAHLLKKEAEIKSLKDKTVYICQWRKYLSPFELGKPASNLNALNLVSIKEAQENAQRVFNEISGQIFLIKPYITRGGYFQQYSVNHSAADFLLMLRCCIDNEILSEEHAREMIYTQMLFLGGAEFGLMPCELFIFIMDRVRLFITSFMSKYEIKYPNDEYQKRAISFFSERLSSYLLIKCLNLPTFEHQQFGEGAYIKPGIPIGTMCNITDDEYYIGGGQNENNK